MKTIDKYQFNEENFTLEEGGNQFFYSVQTHVAIHTVLKRKFMLKMVTQGSQNEKNNYNYLIK